MPAMLRPGFVVGSLVGGLVMVGAGCAQLAGISETTGDHRKVNAVSIQRVSIGATVVTAPLDLTGLTGTFVVPGAQAGAYDRVPATTPAAGTWTLDRPDRVPIEVTYPEVPAPIPHLIDLPSPDGAVGLAFVSMEHPGRTAAPPGATIAVSAALDGPVVAGDTFQAYTVGAWSQRALPTPAVGATALNVAAYPFASSASLSGRPDLDKLQPVDAFLVLRYAGPQLTAAGVAVGFDQTGVDTVTISGGLAKVTADQTLDVKVHPTTISQRLGTLRPATAGAFAMTWQVTAAPGAAYGAITGPQLNAGTVAAADVDLKSARFGNPFVGSRGWRSVLTVTASGTRTYMSGMAVISLAAGIQDFIEPTAGLDLAQPPALPVLISIGGQQLSTDGQSVARPTGYTEVSFITDTTSATLYGLSLDELTVTGTTVSRKPMYTAVGVAPKFVLRPELFEAGHLYTLRATVQLGGFPGDRKSVV